MSRKKATLPESYKASTAAPSSSTTNKDARPRRQTKERLKNSVLEELWSIWRADPRVPSVKSRRSWAISRSASPRLVDNWFSRRRLCAKKSGQLIPDELYELPLDLPVAPRREQSTSPVESELEVFSNLPSDDTLVLVYPPDDDNVKDTRASSDTAFDEGASVEPERTQTFAYKRTFQQPHAGHGHSQPESSSVGLDTIDRCHSDENPTSPVCDQRQGKQSDFTCILCSAKPAQDTSDDTMSGARANLSVPYLRLDFPFNTLSELSAIPFMFRTPRNVPPDSTINYPSTGNLTIVEDELARLVNEGKLDFSFLDVPHLTSMELLD